MKRQLLFSTQRNWSEAHDLEHMDLQRDRADCRDRDACLQRRISVDQIDPAKAVRKRGFDAAMAMYQNGGYPHRLHQEARLSERMSALQH